MCRKFSFLSSVLLFAALAVSTGCANSLPPEGKAIAQASVRVRTSFVDSAKNFYDLPQYIRLRYNPCKCDESIMFDAELFGNWQRIKLSSTPDAMDALVRMVIANAPDTPFELPVLLKTSVTYTSSNHQQFYVFSFNESDVGKIIF